MKLKTLKDCYMSDVANYEQKIREEAIKWIKELKNQNNWKREKEHGIFTNFKYNSTLGTIDYEQDDGEGAIKMLKIFFNITKDDLK